MNGNLVSGRDRFDVQEVLASLEGRERTMRFDTQERLNDVLEHFRDAVSEENGGLFLKDPSGNTILLTASA